MLFGNAYNPAFNAPYCSYYGFSCVFFAILLSFLYFFYGVYLHLMRATGLHLRLFAFYQPFLSAPYPTFIKTLI